MRTITSASGSATYWATVAQIVPVFALALVLELRRSASHWTVAQRWPRRIESAAHLVNAFLLFMAFGSALTALRERPEVLNARIVSVFLLSSLILLVVNPVYLAVVRANVDLLIALPRFWRQFFQRGAKQTLRTAHQQFRELELELAKVEKMASRFIAQARADAAQVGLLETSAREWRDNFLGRLGDSDESTADLQLHSLNSLVEQYDALPSVELATRLRRVKDYMWHHAFATLRRTRASYDSLGTMIDKAEKSMRTRDLSPNELELVTNSIRRAGEESVVIWDPR